MAKADNPKGTPLKLTDHRDIGQQLDLFSFHEVAPGAPFWHPKGMIIFRELEKIAREINDREGYHEVSTPILVKREVFEKSGHWKHYRDNMFYFDNPRDENEHLVIKPMNCPESTYVFNSRVRSYRELPLRLAEIGRLHRNELSGTLGGLFRVRQITMDDAHIYLMPEQVENEIARIVKIIDDFYNIFGFKTSYVLATRPEKALGTEEEWEKAEAALGDALKKSGVKYEIAEGEGAFYGPKVEAHLNDSQGRDWQMGTAQLDLVMLPKQFETYYADENGDKKMPWVIHRAIFGSFERFIGVLLEHTEGKLPAWLSPIQVAVANINDMQLGYAKEVYEKLKENNIRVELHSHNETIGKKIREAEIQKIPYVAVLGEKEEKDKVLAIRKRGEGDKGTMSIEDFIESIKKEIAEKI
ncbi:MAG: threonine--tRNA ligase [Candidatus Paceibacterota bacterium]